MPDTADTSYRSRLPHEILNSLLEQSPYREMWGQFVQRRRGSGVNVRAVATFMAYELSDLIGEEMKPEHLKDSVRRALRGDSLTDATLNRFVSAFGFTSTETQLLLRSIAYQRQVKNLLQSTSEEGQTHRHDPNRSYTPLAETINIYCDRYGLIQTMEVTETVQAERDDLSYLKPIFTVSESQVQVLRGGELAKVSSTLTDDFTHEHNETYQFIIKTPYPLYRGEIHRTKMKLNINETFENNDEQNYIRIGAIFGPKYNVTINIHFEQGLEEVNRCVWDELNEEVPILEESLESGACHYSLFFPIIHKNYCGFSWKIENHQQ